MTGHALLGAPTPKPSGAIHLTLTVAQLDGVIALANLAVDQAAVVLATEERWEAAERGLHRLRAAAQGLRPNDSDQALERLGEALSGVADPDAAALLCARLRDVLDTARLWVSIERVHREAIRDDLDHVDPAGALLQPELLTTAYWRRDAIAVLRSAGKGLPTCE